MTKIVPSPDWFIGLDSVDLCREGAFTHQLTIEVRDRPEEKKNSTKLFEAIFQK